MAKVRKKTKYWISIDPGLQVGAAYWMDDRLIHPSILSCTGETWEQRADDTIRQFWVYLKGHNMRRDLKEVVCEYPAFFQSAGGKTTARSGALVKLALLIGRLEQLVKMEQIAWRSVSVNEWKGQLPKEIVEKRIRKILSPEDVAKMSDDSHDWDAVGIGLYARGRFG